MLELAKDIIERANDKTTKLDFTNFGLFDKDLIALKELLEKKPQITEIKLTGNNLRARSGEILSQLKSLKRIYIAQNNLGDEGARFLLAKENLEYLDLSENDLSPQIEELLAKRRSENVQIVTMGNLKLNSPNVIDQESAALNDSGVTLQGSRTARRF